MFYAQYVNGVLRWNLQSSRTYTSYFERGNQSRYGGDVKLDEPIGILGYLFTISAFLYFSIHSPKLFKENNKLWIVDLILSIPIIIFGYIFSAPGFGYGAIFILMLTVLIFIAAMAFLSIQFWRYKTKKIN